MGIGAGIASAVLLPAGALALRPDAAPAVGDDVVVHEASRSFSQRAVFLMAGQAVTVENTDTSLHHPYVESPGMLFDNGDQEPGTSTTIVFPRAGTFDVVCGIHPRMRMRVEVR